METIIKKKEDVIKFLQESDSELKELSVRFSPTGEVRGFSFNKFEYKFKLPGGVEVK